MLMSVVWIYLIRVLLLEVIAGLILCYNGFAGLFYGGGSSLR